MPAMACVLGGLLLLITNRPLLAGLGFVAGAMMRPDHLLFWGCGGLSLLMTHLYQQGGPILRRLRWGIYARYTAPLICVYLPTSYGG